MTDFATTLAALAFSRVGLTIALVAVGVWLASAWLRDLNDRAEANRQQQDREAFYDWLDRQTGLDDWGRPLVGLSESIYDNLCAEILAAELDDEATVAAWLNGGAA